MDNGELNLKDIYKFIYKRRYTLIYILVTMLLLGIIYTFLIKKPEYNTNTKILIDKTDTSIEEFIGSKDIKKDENINVSFDKNSKIITVETKTKNAEQSFNITNNYINNLEEELQETYGIKTFKMIDTPQISQKASNINYIKDIAIFILIGIVGFMLYIFVLYSKLETTNEYIIERELGKKVLGKVNKEQTKTNKNGKISNSNSINNQLKVIYTNIELNKENKKPKSILFIGTNIRVGNTYIINNLAKQYAELNNKVLIIKSNKKYKDELINIDNINSIIRETDNSNINIVDISEQNNINTELLIKVLDIFKEKFDKILIDTNPILNNSRTIEFSHIVDSIVIVAEAEKTKISEIEKVKQQVEYVDGKISGIVLNKI